MKHLFLAFVLVTASILAISACGADGDESGEAGRSIPGNADPEEAAVIDEWAMTLAAGDVDEAAGFFALPSIAQNGGVLIEIDSLEDARFFNASLPCGARLTRADEDGELTVATFRLSERPGPGRCGSGTGETAQTAFVIEDGAIVEWRRVEAGGPEAPSTPA